MQVGNVHSEKTIFSYGHAAWLCILNPLVSPIEDVRASPGKGGGRSPAAGKGSPATGASPTAGAAVAEKAPPTKKAKKENQKPE